MVDTGVVTRVGFFVGVLVLAVVAGSVASGGSAGTAPAVNQIETPSFDANESAATAPAQTGELTMAANASGEVILIDAGHGAEIDREALAPIVTTLTENGATVKYHVGERQGGRSLNASLREADAFLVLGAESRYTEAQLAGLDAFTDAGGRVLVMNEPAQASYGGLVRFGMPRGRSSVTSPLAPVLSQHGLAYDNGYLYNMDEYALNYRSVYATPTGSSPLTEGVDRTVLYTSTPITGSDTLLTTTDGTTLSQTRRQGTYGVLARSGNVVAVGDSSIATQEFLYRADNEQLVGNLLDFLVSGEKSPADAPQKPEPSSETGPTPGPEQTRP
ncbi:MULTISPECIES: DUF4350 domain-containing protein [Haloarcula]|uniref:DUF4350 domain-containing protein n=1 Tax=Haloarcula TaxID=2237 RepID=UPI0023EB8079|nr:DUF4350 domain-containing protein [Halomicroarcula sp. XH51]